MKIFRDHFHKYVAARLTFSLFLCASQDPHTPAQRLSKITGVRQLNRRQREAAKMETATDLMPSDWTVRQFR